MTDHADDQQSTKHPDPDLRVRVDHVGIAVSDREPIATVLQALGGELIADEPADGFRWIQYELGNLSRIELIEPTEEGTFLTEFLDARGPGLHHVTLEVAALDAMVAHLERHGIRVVDQADHHRYREAFISPRSTNGTLFQLMEYEPGYTEAYGEPGVDEDLVVDTSFIY